MASTLRDLGPFTLLLLVFGAASGCTPPLSEPSESSPNGSGSTSSTGVGGAGVGGTGAGVGGATNGTGATNGAGGAITAAPGCELGYRELPDNNGGINVEQVCFADTMIDRAASLAAFETNVYPLLHENCSDCHSAQGLGQAPMHSDADVELAHEYALTRVNFRKPVDSKLVVRLSIDRHNCFGSNCADAGNQMLAAVTAWANAVTPSLEVTPRGVPEGETVTEAQVIEWINADKATLAAADAKYVKYASFHEIHNAGVSADEMNVARVGLSKALNTAARWAPQVANPVDINGKGIVYRFDTRWYWGYNKGVTKLHFGGSDDDVFFGRTSVNYLGQPVTSNITSEETYNFTSTVQEDASFAELVWGRILAGNVEGATDSQVLPPNVNGFKNDYVEAGQLTYTITRPDVYNAIMAIPWYADQLEKELGVILDNGMKSYEYMLTFQAITVDSRMYWRARLPNEGYYWKTWDTFTGQLPSGINTIEAAYEQGYIRYPFWANPIPKFVSAFGGGFPGQTENFSFVATLAQVQKSQAPAGCDGQENFGDPNQYNCRYFTGTGGLQQSAEEVIWSLPNGLQGYALFGGFNQRRVDAFVNIVRDPRIVRDNTDAQINSNLGFATYDRRLNTGSSCIGCHADGMNRGNNDLRDWLDFDRDELPKGVHGVDGWINDQAVVDQVKELYPPSTVMRPRMETDRRRYLATMAQIKAAMMLGNERNTYVEPAIWTIEWARDFYKYPTTRSN